ncbi:TonB-dependent receptor [Microbulbifer halophilus]|uniref:TonB-dependent receptor n=1 Tax=Microbulbifer halophilus TaxID=453963 RepID=A0ABW5EGW2_9GAMM|nr:TonB-dependent receptor [Microbulbifer halophilus]MCW8125725.1 TonB-dependent receptor [Microbulbifer halophilus]
MFQKNRLHSAVIAATAAIMGSQAAHAEPKQIEEVTVTATKRAESAQDIPVAVQALGEENLENLNVSNFDDYIRHMPNVTAGGRGPGQSSIYIRGMATETIATQLSQANGTAPNVALYMDEAPVSIGGRNLDVYVTDIERVEVLKGPQGTLFGASSQAGTVRLITNKPKLNEFELGIDAGLATTKDGEMSDTLETVVNLPVIDDKLAVRVAAYQSNEGGYIDNVAGTYTPDADVNPVWEGLPVESATNEDLVEEDFNDASYQGARLGVKWAINDDWEALVQHTHQDLEADGVFDHDPENVGDLQVQRYFEDSLEDSFDLTSWTLEGRLAALDVVYTGAYLDREVEQSMDYTGYNDVGGYVDYYTCNTAGDTCYDPTKAYVGTIENTRTSHELRISTPQENALRFTGGAFYEDVEILDNGNFLYPSVADLGNHENYPRGWAPDTADDIPATVIDPNPRPAEVAFFNDITRTQDQLAFFGELSYDLTDQLTGTVGLRHYDMDVELVGSANSSFDTLWGEDTDEGGGDNLDQKWVEEGIDTPLNESDTITKFTLSYTPNSDVLLYATYSEGFRPPAYNRGGGNSNADGSITIPYTVSTDTVDNYEAGWKTSLADHSLQFNGSIYRVDWKDIQTAVFDPSVYFLFYLDNSLDAQINGIETDITWLPTDNLQIIGALSYNDTEITDVPESAVNVAPEGSELALSPALQMNLRARYDWTISSFDAYWQAGVQYSDDAWSSIVVQPNDRFKQDAYATVDASVGLQEMNWGVELYAENLTDERAELFINTLDGSKRTTTNRPRTMGVRVSYDF